MTIPICCVTGRIAGDQFACGDCDPCLASYVVPEPVRKLMMERDEWMTKYEGAVCGGCGGSGEDQNPLNDPGPCPGLVAEVQRSVTTHDLYRTEDKDAPDCIRDRNGEVVLGLCRRCGRGEIELTEPCDGRKERT